MRIVREGLGWLFAALVVVVVNYGCSKREQFVASLPDRPDFSDRPVELERRIERAEKEVREEGDPQAAFADLAALYYANGYSREALEAYQALRMIDGGNARWPHLLARILSGYGRSAQAAELYREAVDLNSSYAPSRLQLGNVLEKMGHFAEAADAYSVLLESDPENKYALAGLARSNVQLDDLLRAKELAEKAVRIDEEFVPAWRALASALREIGDETAAEKADQRARGHVVDAEDLWYEETLRFSYDAYQLVVAAETLLTLGNEAGAIRLLQRAANIAPDQALPRRRLGMIFLSGGNFEKAKTHLEKAVSIDRDDSENWIRLLDFYDSTNALLELENALKSALRSCPDSPSLHLRQGRVHRGKNEYDKAIASFRRSIELRPQVAETYLDLSRVYFSMGDVEAGVEEVRGALRAEPNHAVALSVLARVAIGEFEREEVDSILQKVMIHESIPAKDKSELRRLYRYRFD